MQMRGSGCVKLCGIKIMFCLVTHGLDDKVLTLCSTAAVVCDQHSLLSVRVCLVTQQATDMQLVQSKPPPTLVRIEGIHYAKLTACCFESWNFDIKGYVIVCLRSIYPLPPTPRGGAAL